MTGYRLILCQRAILATGPAAAAARGGVYAGGRSSSAVPKRVIGPAQPGWRVVVTRGRDPASLPPLSHCNVA